MTLNMTFTQPDIAVAVLAGTDPRYSQMSGERSAQSMAARIHVVSGFGADPRIPTDVAGVPPRGVPV